jgi:hypothetical protein
MSPGERDALEAAGRLIGIDELSDAEIIIERLEGRA